MAYECGNCHTTKQWSCNCWRSEAATWVAGRAEGQDRLDRLRRAHQAQKRHRWT